MTAAGAKMALLKDVMPGAVEKRVGRQLLTEPLEWLTDIGSACSAHEIQAFARLPGLEPYTTAVRSPESNGIAESCLKTIKVATSVSCRNRTARQR